MTPQEFQRIYPLIAEWIAQMLRCHAPLARPVESAGFARLAHCFSPQTLASSKYILVAECPVPPLASWGLDRFSDFQKMAPDGITYLDCYFVRATHQYAEDLHFHELIHVMQWRLLGSERFIALYADGLERYGYQHSPLEAMAYDGQEVFASGRNFDAETYVRRALAKTYPGIAV